MDPFCEDIAKGTLQFFLARIACTCFLTCALPKSEVWAQNSSLAVRGRGAKLGDGLPHPCSFGPKAGIFRKNGLKTCSNGLERKQYQHPRPACFGFLLTLAIPSNSAVRPRNTSKCPKMPHTMAYTVPQAVTWYTAVHSVTESQPHCGPHCATTLYSVAHTVPQAPALHCGPPCASGTATLWNSPCLRYRHNVINPLPQAMPHCGPHSASGR